MTRCANLFLCSCEKSQKIDPKVIASALDLDDTPKIYSHLCRSQVDALKTAPTDGEAPIICCTQEAPILMEAWEDHCKEAGAPTVSPLFVNIRETAGWSDQGGNASAKMAAIIAESQISPAGATTVSLTSTGRTLVLGHGDDAVAAAKRLAPHLDVTLLLEGSADIVPPAQGDVPIYTGKVITAAGHLGDFSVSVSDVSLLEPSSRGKANFHPVSGIDNLGADIIVDLRGGTPLFPAPEKRDGYLRITAGEKGGYDRILFDALNMVGEFEKPRYVEHNSAICAHSRSNIVACTRCIDGCPTGAISSANERISIDPYVCAGCGGCASTCPTGAIAYQYSNTDDLHARARTLLDTYAKAGGSKPVLLIKDQAFGDDVISILARMGRGLPANVLPLSVNEVTQIGLESLLAFGAFGVSAIKIIADPKKADETVDLKFQIELANIILRGLGYGTNRIDLLIEQDPSVIEEILYSGASLAQMPGKPFVVNGAKRSALSTVLRALHTSAPSPVDRIPLPDGAPLGNVTIVAEGCTLCLACVGACPTGALKSNPETPQLRFSASACVQCGLCRKTCPEKVITLNAEIDFTHGVRDSVVLKEEEPFKCTVCNKPFATRSSINLMMEKLKDHPMFAAEGALDRLKMCEVCRVGDIVNSGNDPWDTGQRRQPKTTDDYIRERDETD